MATSVCMCTEQHTYLLTQTATTHKPTQPPANKDQPEKPDLKANKGPLERTDRKANKDQPERTDLKANKDQPERTDKMVQLGQPDRSTGSARSRSQYSPGTKTVAQPPPSPSVAARGVAYDGTNIYIANYTSNNVSVVDPATNTVTTTIGVETAVRGTTTAPRPGSPTAAATACR